MSVASEKNLLKGYGYFQGDKDAEGTCGDCSVTCNGNRGWWYRCSPEYDEWDCRCKKCALIICENNEVFQEEMDAKLKLM